MTAQRQKRKPRQRQKRPRYRIAVRPVWPALLLLRLFFADFAEQFFAAQFTFFFDDDFAQPRPACF